MRWTDIIEAKEAKGILPLTDENIQAAKSFLFQKWKERAAERYENEPTDMSRSCKFVSQFVQKVFGGRMEGHYDHQYNVINGKVVDLNADAEDVKRLENPHHHDTAFWGNRDHKASMKSCLPRVNTWVEEFLKQMGV
jgi:hypothetical protein